jgi:hypothetical protein
MRRGRLAGHRVRTIILRAAIRRERDRRGVGERLLLVVEGAASSASAALLSSA